MVWSEWRKPVPTQSLLTWSIRSAHLLEEYWLASSRDELFFVSDSRRRLAGSTIRSSWLRSAGVDCHRQDCEDTWPSLYCSTLVWSICHCHASQCPPARQYYGAQAPSGLLSPESSLMGCHRCYCQYAFVWLHTLSESIYACLYTRYHRHPCQAHSSNNTDSACHFLQVTAGSQLVHLAQPSC